jgi:isoleucyl-tRNA synthetase
VGENPRVAPRRLADKALYASLPKEIWDELLIVSDHKVAEGAGPEGAFRLNEVPGVAATVGIADGHKCERCWRVLPEVGSRPAHPRICVRCADAVDRA